MSMKSLIKAWRLPDRSNERAQVTLRIPFSDYARLHALKKIYPLRSVNDILADIINLSIDEIVAALPSRPANEHDVFEYNSALPSDLPSGCYLEPGDLVGPAVDFENAYRQILESKSEEDAKESAA